MQFAYVKQFYIGILSVVFMYRQLSIPNQLIPSQNRIIKILKIYQIIDTNSSDCIYRHAPNVSTFVSNISYWAYSVHSQTGIPIASNTEMSLAPNESEFDVKHEIIDSETPRHKQLTAQYKR